MVRRISLFKPTYMQHSDVIILNRISRKKISHNYASNTYTWWCAVTAIEIVRLLKLYKIERQVNKILWRYSAKKVNNYVTPTNILYITTQTVIIWCKKQTNIQTFTLTLVLVIGNKRRHSTGCHSGFLSGTQRRD